MMDEVAAFFLLNLNCIYFNYINNSYFILIPVLELLHTSVQGTSYRYKLKAKDCLHNHIVGCVYVHDRVMYN